jgi:4-hydroxybenzoate polyprenyltransferase
LSEQQSTPGSDNDHLTVVSEPIDLRQRREAQWEPLASAPSLIRALRPLQWTKSLLVFAALIFTRSVFELDPLMRTIGAFVVFCMASSAIYLINDLQDIEKDRFHPVKRLRPIAAGHLEPRTAALLASGLAIASLAGSFLIRPELALVIGIYLALMLGYTFGLKRLVILDVFIIASGFVLRAAAGAVAISVPISPWLYICSLLLALFLGFGKRRHELLSLRTAAARHRENLDAYSVSLLDQLIAVTAAATVIAYSVYTFQAPTLPENHAMMATIPFVLYAVFRYLYLLYKKQEGGSPEVLLVRDRPLLLSILGWAITSMAILYWA